MFSDRIFVVLVLYKTKLENSVSFISLNNILRTHNEYIEMLVYDNSPSPQCVQNKFIECQSYITYIHDVNNAGVSKAYNVGAKMASDINKQWLLLLDDDTELVESYWHSLEYALSQNSKIDLFVPQLISNGRLISPCKFILNNGFILKSIQPGINGCKKKTILNSCILVSCEAFQQVGGYDESVKLYYSDYVFFQKYKKKYKYFFVLDAGINHHLSEDNLKNLERLEKVYELNCIGAKAAMAKLEWGIFLYLWCIIRALLWGYNWNTMAFVKIYRKIML